MYAASWQAANRRRKVNSMPRKKQWSDLKRSDHWIRICNQEHNAPIVNSSSGGMLFVGVADKVLLPSIWPTSTIGARYINSVSNVVIYR